MEIRKIVITGGPSAGKTTGLSWVQNAFTKLGYTVLFVPETATEFISGGVAPWTCGTNLDYQKVQMTLQLEKERLFEQAARTMRADKILIVCDRGALDNKAYMNDGEFSEVLRCVGRTEQELLASYDAVFHMVTAARGAEQFYTRENNKARYESVSEAVALDARLVSQMFLPAKEGEELRIRRREENGSTIYYKTLKRRVAEHKRIEIEERLTQGEYLSLMMDAEPGARPLNKTRYCLTYEGQYFEIDLYPFWRDRALVEIELSDRDDEIRMPEGLKVIREVTGDPAYKNAALARLA